MHSVKINPAEAPKAYADLADPKWKGKLGIEADDGNWLMSVAGVMGEDKAVALFRTIEPKNRIWAVPVWLRIGHFQWDDPGSIAHRRSPHR